MRSSTETIIGALRVLARDIQTDDGVINAYLNEAAERLQEMSAWNHINYADPSTYPEENRPCIVAWAEHPEHPDRHAMHVFNDVGDNMRLWQNAIGDEVHDWDGTIENPTHWMYAPEYQPWAGHTKPRVTRCTGKQDTPDINFVVPCPARDNCQRYTDKPPESAAWISWIHAPRISKRGCDLMIKRLSTAHTLTRANSSK